jgi:hypothetical protein
MTARKLVTKARCVVCNHADRALIEFARVECRMATTFTARRGGHRCDKCLKGSHTNT